MKNFYPFFLFMILFPLTGNAQVTLTQSVDPVNVTDGGVACWSNTTGEYRENSFFRSYNLAEYGVVGDFNITNVQYGQRSADDGKVITLNIYTASSLNLATATLTLVESTTHISSAADDISLVSVPMTATVPANSIIAFEVMAGDSGAATGQTYFPGINDAGQNAPSYLEATACGITAPADTAGVSAASQYVMNVIGNDALSIDEFGLKSVSIFPNPVMDELKIHISDATRINTIEIYSITGQIIFKRTYSNSLDVSNLKAGI